MASRGTRTLVAVLLLAGPAVPVAASAPARSCNLITDRAGDGEHGASLDIVGGDLGATADRVTAVIRLAEFSRSNPYAATGQAWYLEWRLHNHPAPLYLGVHVTPTAEYFEFGLRENVYRSLGRATGVIDEARREIRITAPLRAWGPLGQMRAGTRLLLPAAAAYWFVGAAFDEAAVNSLSPSDSAPSSRSYVVGKPTCVPVGR